MISFVNILRKNVSRDDKKFVNVFYDEVTKLKINQRIDLDKICSHLKCITTSCAIDLLLGVLKNDTNYLKFDILHDQKLNDTMRLITLKVELKELKLENKLLREELDLYNREPNLS